MTNIERCNLILASLVGKKLIDNWWHTPHRAFNMLTPWDQFKLDEHKVLDYLYGQMSGDYS